MRGRTHARHGKTKPRRLALPLSASHKALEACRDVEIAPPFSVANTKQQFQALLITKSGVRGDVGSRSMQRVCKSSYGGMEKFVIGRTCASFGYIL